MNLFQLISTIIKSVNKKHRYTYGKGINDAQEKLFKLLNTLEVFGKKPIALLTANHMVVMVVHLTIGSVN